VSGVRLGSFEGQAENWIGWAARPADPYWHFGPSFFNQIVPAEAARALEIGCGEGRVCRDLAARGHRVIGIDVSRTLIAHARKAGPRETYLVADAASLPFRDGLFELVVAYNSLINMPEMAAAVREAARVMAQGGRLCVCVPHPMWEAGTFAGEGSDASFVVHRPYLASTFVDFEAELEGGRMRFRGWTHPIEAYSRAIEDASLVIDMIREPPSRRTRRLPLFLFLRASKK
jgi:SAM-dependent methyltransferase